MTDFNDMHQKEGLIAVRERIDNAEAPPKKPPYVPFGFTVTDRGVFKKKGDDELGFAICSPLYIQALIRDNNSNNWGRLLVWTDPDNKKHEYAMPSSMMAEDGAEYRRILLDNGLSIYPGRPVQNALNEYIMTADPEARAASVNIPGWHGKRYISLDGIIYGQDAERAFLQASGTLPKLVRKGTLEGWQKNVALCAQSNSRLVLAISTAFAGSLLYFAGEGSGGFHISGASSGGKTTALRVAVSVWGMALRSWRTTDNAAESWARFANDGFLAIDELGQVDGKAADQMAYMLGNGQTKGRSNKDGVARDTTEFRLIFLSTGEIGLADKIGERKMKAKAGQAVRMLEIPDDAGMGMRLFEELHGHSSADEFAKYLRQATEENQGHAISVWLEKLAKISSEELRDAISKLTKAWMDEHVPPFADGQVMRAARRFALVAIAGELAATLGIVPWPDKEASNAVARCFHDWLDARGGGGSYEVQEGIKAILDFINRFSASRFAYVSGRDDQIRDHAGFKVGNDDDSEVTYLVFPEVLRSEILGGSKNVSAILKAAVQQGLIEPDSEGKTSKPVTLPGGLGKKRMIHVTPFKYKEEIIS